MAYMSHHVRNESSVANLRLCLTFGCATGPTRSRPSRTACGQGSMALLRFRKDYPRFASSVTGSAMAKAVAEQHARDRRAWTWR